MKITKRGEKTKSFFSVRTSTISCEIKKNRCADRWMDEPMDKIMHLQKQAKNERTFNKLQLNENKVVQRVINYCNINSDSFLIFDVRRTELAIYHGR